MQYLPQSEGALQKQRQTFNAPNDGIARLKTYDAGWLVSPRGLIMFMVKDIHTVCHCAEEAELDDTGR